MDSIDIISLDGGSDFFNLNNLTNLMLQQERKKKEEIESKEKPTLGRWIWNTMKDLGEVILKSETYEEEILWNEKTIEISHKKYILGLEVEHVWAKKTFSEVIKGLTKEEWDWVIMDPEVLYIIEGIFEWFPKEDPRPDW